jgi:hypothetical protein
MQFNMILAGAKTVSASEVRLHLDVLVLEEHNVSDNGIVIPLNNPFTQLETQHSFGFFCDIFVQRLPVAVSGQHSVRRRPYIHRLAMLCSRTTCL